jgi:hypothetical protein
MESLVRLVFDILVALLLLAISIISFIHAQKGKDIAGITFGVAFLVLLISRIVLIITYFNTGFVNIAGSHFNEYLVWYDSITYIPFAVGCFASIFASGKLWSVVWTPAILAISALLALPFFEKLFPLIEPYGKYGSFVWYVTFVILLATALVYFFYNYKASDRYRLWMGIGFLLIAASMAINIFCGNDGLDFLISKILWFSGLFVIFYEVSYA